MKNLVAIIGRFGEGKSLKLIELGCKLANEYQMRVIANFPINRKEFIAYGKSKGYKWIHNVRIIHFDLFQRAMELTAGDKRKLGECLSKAIQEFLDNSNSVILFDEVGVYMNSRGWQSVTIELLACIFQLRKENTHLICAFQNYAQVDKQLRENIQQYIFCTGVSKYSKALKLPRMYARFAYYYEPEKFHQKMEKDANMLRSWLMAAKVEWSYFGMVQPFFDLFNFFNYIYTEFANIFRFYKGKKPLKHKRIDTDEHRLFRCFSSARRIDKMWSTSPSKVIRVTGQSIPDSLSVTDKSKKKLSVTPKRNTYSRNLKNSDFIELN